MGHRMTILGRLYYASPATRGVGVLSDDVVRPYVRTSVRLSVWLSVPCLYREKTLHFRHMVTIGNHMFEVETTSQRGLMTIKSGRNGLDLEKFTASISRKRKQIELWLLLNTNIIIICHSHPSRLITGKDRTRLLTSSAITTINYCHIAAGGILCYKLTFRHRHDLFPHRLQVLAGTLGQAPPPSSLDELTVEGFHLDTAGSGEDSTAITTSGLAVFLVEFAGVIEYILAFRLRPVDRRTHEAADRLHYTSQTYSYWLNCVWGKHEAQILPINVKYQGQICPLLCI